MHADQVSSAPDELRALLARNRVPQNCKVCGKSPVRKVGEVDFNRVAGDPPPFPASGIEVAYWQCQTCGFAWAPVFDEWNDDLFAKFIYNQKIDQVETPENAARRCRNVAALLGGWFAGYPATTRFLDYGCGPGFLVDALGQYGFQAIGYDRFQERFSARPQGKFDVVTSFEVMEHINDIRATIDDMLSFLAPGGLMVLGTFLAENPMKIDWWYCSPRSGHVSFWTFPALETIFHKRKLNVASDGKTFHFVFSDAAKAHIMRIFGSGNQPK